jgi:hypothetical protein
VIGSQASATYSGSSAGVGTEQEGCDSTLADFLKGGTLRSGYSVTSTQETSASGLGYRPGALAQPAKDAGPDRTLDFELGVCLRRSAGLVGEESEGSGGRRILER